MRKIVYYVASSVDGFIAGADGDIGMFLLEGDGVTKYMEDLQGFDTVIMGRKTYEFGYQFGLKPGQKAYPHMKHYICSSSLKFENSDSEVEVVRPEVPFFQDLKKEEGAPIYLCGGGDFAGWLLEQRLIDEVKIKLNPILLGEGVPLFGSATVQNKLIVKEQECYSDGLQVITYELV